MYQNPYYLQPYQNNNFGGTIPGRYVSDFGMITANDVPMDGNYAIFPKNDLTEIQLRKWNPNGQISNVTFKPALPTQTDNLPQDKEQGRESALKCVEVGLYERLDSISEKLDRLLVPARSAKKVAKDESAAVD